MNTDNIKDKMYGCLYGQAIGDALGLGSEFMSKIEVLSNYPDGLSRYDQIVRDFHRALWNIGDWTDDTEMMLCILKAYDNGHFDIGKIACLFKDWYEGDPLGMGNHIFNVLSHEDYIDQPEICSKYEWILSDCQSAANGALMRTSVVALPENYSANQTEDICKLTHYDPRCIGSCVIVTDIIHNLVWYNKEMSYEDIIRLGDKYDERMREWIYRAYSYQDISKLNLDEQDSLGYTLRSLSAALWCYWHSPSFEEGLLSVVNEGGDADTNAAIACSILGAKFGFAAIPKYYIDNLRKTREYYGIISEFINKTIGSYL